MEIFHDFSSFSLTCSDLCHVPSCHSDVKVFSSSMAKEDFYFHHTASAFFLS